MRLTVTRAFSMAGVVQPVGSIVDVDKKFAAELIHTAKAVATPDVETAPAADVEPAAEAPAKPVTKGKSK